MRESLTACLLVCAMASSVCMVWFGCKSVGFGSVLKIGNLNLL